MRSDWASWSLLVACGAAAVAAGSARADRVWGSALALPMDMTRVAVRSATAPADGAQWLVRDWWLVGVGPGGAGVASVDELRGSIDALIAGGAAFAAPVLIGAHGGLVIPTPVVLAGVDASANGWSLALDAGWAVDRPWTSFPDLVRLSAPQDMRNGLDVLAAAERLAAATGVRFAEANMLQQATADFVPSDPNFNQSWALRNTGQNGGLIGFDLNTTRAWDWTLGDPNITAIIIDDGVERLHPDLVVGPGIDVTGDNGDGGVVTECDWHATWCAGMFAARVNNARGSSGVAPRVTLGSARALIGGCGSRFTEADWTVFALDWVVSIGARVTSNSSSYPFQSQAVVAAYQSSRALGVVHFASAGNNSAGSVNFPGIIPGVNAVAAVNRFGLFSEFSNAGDGLSFVAPGESIFSTDPIGAQGFNSGDYATVGGTSMSSPAAAGVAALVLSLYPHLSAAQVESIMQRSARDLGPEGYDLTFGWGMPDARNALFTACPPDFNRDGFLNQEDLAGFLTAWLNEPAAVPGPGGYSTGPCTGSVAGFVADFDGDCIVNQEDLSGFITSYFDEVERPDGCTAG